MSHDPVVDGTLPPMPPPLPSRLGPEPPPPLPDASADLFEGRLHTTQESGMDDERPVDLSATAPPWLISLFFHMSLVLLLALIVIRQNPFRLGDIQLNYSEDLGQQLLDASADDLVIDPGELGDDKVVLQDLLMLSEPASTPLAASATPLVSGSGLGSGTSIRELLAGRRQDLRKGLLGKFGGDETTQAAVEAALKWLKKNQRGPGNWSLTGPYADGVRVHKSRSDESDNPESATAMALLAFQGAGYTHLEGEYADTVNSGWKYLLSRQQEDGSFFNAADSSQRQYTNAQCTIALCEILAMTKDESRFKRPAINAVRYLVETQAEEGGWRYVAGRDSDMSVTGWVAMALQSARMAELEVPGEVFYRLEQFLDSVERTKENKNTGKTEVVYAYRENAQTTPALTAEGLLCRMYLGWPHEEERLKMGMNHLESNPIKSDRANVYYWYYGTQVMHHFGGSYWQKWNSIMKKELTSTQVKEGKEAGSWSPRADEWGLKGGRLYVTCLSTYMLEVYYRHLPLYDSIYDNETDGAQPGQKVADGAANPEQTDKPVPEKR